MDRQWIGMNCETQRREKKTAHAHFKYHMVDDVLRNQHRSACTLHATADTDANVGWKSFFFFIFFFWLNSAETNAKYVWRLCPAVGKCEINAEKTLFNDNFIINNNRYNEHWLNHWTDNVKTSDDESNWRRYCTFCVLISFSFAKRDEYVHI